MQSTKTVMATITAMPASLPPSGDATTSHRAPHATREPNAFPMMVCLRALASPPEWKKQAHAMNAAQTASPMARSRKVATPPGNAILKDNASSCDMAMLLRVRPPGNGSGPARVKGSLTSAQLFYHPKGSLSNREELGSHCRLKISDLRSDARSTIPHYRPD